MADRKAELERKKLKLEQMRKEREEKNRQRKFKEVKILQKYCSWLRIAFDLWHII